MEKCYNESESTDKSTQITTDMDSNDYKNIDLNNCKKVVSI